MALFINHRIYWLRACLSLIQATVFMGLSIIIKHLVLEVANNFLFILVKTLAVVKGGEEGE